MAVDERFTTVGGRPVRWMAVGPADPPARHGSAIVVVVPGLGLPGYTMPTALALAERGVEVAVLDLPGFGSRQPDATRSLIHAIGLTTARWIEAEAAHRAVVVLGHSTGAQAALTTALALSGRRAQLSLVLAGPTFAPEQRRLASLIAATPTAYRDDTLLELVAAELWRARAGIVSILHSGLRDAPDERIANLAVPVTITAGVHDSYAPVDWLDRLAVSAVRAPSVRTSLLGGSHNNLFTHPDELAELILLAVADAER